MVMHRIRSSRGGQAMVEFALLVPVFFMMLIGLLDFGRAGFYYVASTSLARSGPTPRPSGSRSPWVVAPSHRRCR
ncbi:MAG: pilus assembly protein [Chloroflexota bacterium]|nr:MAG: pilus assembly protein [Chloroflexota bacterium]